MLKVLIVDDHATLRRGLLGLLKMYPAWEVCGEADSGEAAIRAAAELKPDVIIMDVAMPGMGGMQATQIIHEAFPAVKIVLFTLHKSTELIRAGFSRGATGYVLKSDPENELISALEAVIRDEIYVTACISPETVSDIVRDMKRSRGVTTDSTRAFKASNSQP